VFGTQVAEVEVDTVTGEVQVLGIWAQTDRQPLAQCLRMHSRRFPVVSSVMKT
jgi:hypothetical protein